MAVSAALVHKPFYKQALNLPPLNIMHIQLKGWKICIQCSHFVVVNWGSIFELHPQPFLFASFFEATFSPALSQVKYFTCRVYLFFRFLMKSNITSTRSDFSFKKKLQAEQLLSYMTSSQCFLLPKVGVEGELMSKKSLSPKIFYQATAFLLSPCC